jgi:hypothetical protein
MARRRRYRRETGAGLAEGREKPNIGDLYTKTAGGDPRALEKSGAFTAASASP